MKTVDAVMKILAELKPGFDFGGKTDLATSGDLDSFDIITLVSDLEDALDIEIPVEKIVPENFESIDAIVALADSVK